MLRWWCRAEPFRWGEVVEKEIALAEGQPVVLCLAERDDGKAELAEEDRPLEHRSLANFRQGLFAFEALDGLNAYLGVFGIARVDGDDFGGADEALPTLEW